MSVCDLILPMRVRSCFESRVLNNWSVSRSRSFVRLLL
jgi:hypothetical protein